MKFLLIGIVIVAWLASEFKGNRPVRIALGVFSILAVWAATHFVDMMTRSYERHFYAVAFMQAEGVLAKGDTNTVLRAIQAHNAALRTGNVYHAAQTFMSGFSAGNGPLYTP